MASKLPSRDEAQRLLEKHVRDDYQRHHAGMVARAMEAYAKKFGEDEGLWFLTGLLHDLDYYEYPDAHPETALEWYKGWGLPEEFIHAVEAHAHKAGGVEPETKLAAALIACDELSGFLYAYSLMRPTGFEGMNVKSVKKKFKDKSFAAKVNRDEIMYGVEKFEVDFAGHINFLIKVFSKD